MNIPRKKITKVLALVLTATLVAISIGPFSLQTVFADSNNETEISPTHYYYQHLVTGNGEDIKEYSLAKKFYRLLEEMNLKGDFKDGIISYDLRNIVSQSQLKAWVENGNLEIPKAFGAARDSFLMDHPELFYIDFYKIQLSAGYSGGVYKGFIDCGREANIYRNDAFNNEQDVEKAIMEYNTAVETVANNAKATVSDCNPLYKNDAALAIAVNNELSKSVKYDFGLFEDWQANGDNAEFMASLGYTGYGALINKQAVCAGYSQAFKSVMDYLNIPCVIVSGYSKGIDENGNDTDGNVGHAWNYVELETTPKGEDSSAWFAFDTTWNSASKENMKYSLMEHATAAKRHNPQGVISSSGYELEYPVLSALNYAEAVNTDMKNREILTDDFSYRRTVKPFEAVFDVKEYVSWQGKNAGELADLGQADGVAVQSDENVRIAMRYYYIYDGVKQWSKWQDLANSSLYDGMGIMNEQGQTEIYIANNMLYTQYAVVKNLMPDEDITMSEDWVFEGIYYSDDDLVSQNALYISEKFENPVYGTYTAAPYININKTTPGFHRDYTITDDMKNPNGDPVMPDNKAILMKIVYDEPLHVLDESQDIMVEMETMHENAKEYAGFVAFSDGKYVHLTTDENGVANTLEFKFKPSLMYEHNREGYELSFKNVGSAKLIEKRNSDGQLVMTTSDKAPNSAYYVFSREYIACPNVFGDGRLWVDCCAQPTLVGTSDFSISNFKDENGNSTFSESATSQMMLVVNDVTTKTVDDMMDELEANDNIGINRNDIISSQTYDIKLQICGKYKKIPDKSRVQIALGFPEGYGPKDEGVTFKLFHRKHISGNEYIIEEIPCVVTPFGIVATVESFSPYMVAAVDASSVTEKKVYATIDGNGGTLSSEDNQIQVLNEGDSYTYSITADEGYQVYSVTLNGKDVLRQVVDGKLTVNYADLERDNEIEIKYIANGAVKRVMDNDIVTPVKVVVDGGTANVISDVIETPKDLEIVEPETPVEPSETWSDTVYTWSADGKFCTAKRISDSGQEETTNAAVTSKQTKAPTCTEDGETTYIAVFSESWAKRQTKLLTDVPATGHTFSWVIDKEATGTETGVKHEECTVCGFAKNDVEIPMITDTEKPDDTDKPSNTEKPDGIEQPNDNDFDKNTVNNDNSDKNNNASDSDNKISPETGINANTPIYLWISGIYFFIIAAIFVGTSINTRKRKR